MRREKRNSLGQPAEAALSVSADDGLSAGDAARGSSRPTLVPLPTLQVYEEGVLRRAQPVDRLRQKLADFEARMEMRRKRRLESGMPAEPEPERFALSSLQARSRALSAPRPGAGTLSGATGALGGAVAGQGAPGLGNAGGPSLDVFQDDEASLGRGGLPAAGGGAFRGGLAGVGERSKENVMRASEVRGFCLRRASVRLPSPPLPFSFLCHRPPAFPHLFHRCPFSPDPPPSDPSPLTPSTLPVSSPLFPRHPRLPLFSAVVRRVPPTPGHLCRRPRPRTRGL